MGKKRLTWKTDWAISPTAYSVKEHDNRAEIQIPVSGVSKRDCHISHRYWGKRGILTIEIPDTRISDSRTFQFEVGEGFTLKGARVNIRENVLYVYIPKKEGGKPTTKKVS